MSTISVVIVNYRTPDMLRNCLASLDRQRVSLQVIVVDNGSEDGSVEMVRREFPKAVLIANTENRGFAAANNQGFAVATGEYVVMLNSDTIIPDPSPGSVLQGMVDYLASHPTVGVLAPALRNGEGGLQKSASWEAPGLLSQFYEYTLLNRLFYRLFPNRRYPGKLLLAESELTKEQKVGDLLGACLVFRHRLLEEIGQLDERFFIFLEETDFNLRVHGAGYELRYVPQFTVIHYWGSSIDAGSKLEHRYNLFFTSLYAFFRKHHGPLYAATAWIITAGCAAITILLTAILWIPTALVAVATRKSLDLALTKQWPILWGALRWHLGMARHQARRSRSVRD